MKNNHLCSKMKLGNFNYILYCAFRKPELVNETIYSLLSLYYTCSDLDGIQIIILTDRNMDWSGLTKYIPEAKQNLSIAYIEDEVIEEWTNWGTYPFTIKIKAIEYVLKKYKGKLIFIDSDTFILKDIGDLFNKISKDRFVMLFANHLDFWGLKETGMYESLFAQIEIKHERMIFQKDTFEIPLSFRHYNSGIIGICYENYNILEEVLALSNLAFQKYHMVVAEEFAYACTFQKYGRIHTCDSFVFHYLYAKWARFFGARFFQLYYNQDYELYLDWLRKHSIDEFSLPQIDYKDLPAFIHFIDSYILQNNSLRRDYLYLGGKNSYAEQLLLDEGKRARFAFLYEKIKRRLQGF